VSEEIERYTWVVGSRDAIFWIEARFDAADRRRKRKPRTVLPPGRVMPERPVIADPATRYACLSTRSWGAS
jgi:hypothetical protein